MAVVLHAGVETGDLSEFTGIVGTVSASQVQVNTGSYALRANPINNDLNYAQFSGSNTRVTAYVYIATAPDVDETGVEDRSHYS